MFFLNCIQSGSLKSDKCLQFQVILVLEKRTSCLGTPKGNLTTVTDPHIKLPLVSCISPVHYNMTFYDIFKFLNGGYATTTGKSNSFCGINNTE